MQRLAATSATLIKDIDYSIDLAPLIWNEGELKVLSDVDLILNIARRLDLREQPTT